MEKDLHKKLEEVALEMYPPRIGDISYKHCDVNADTRETLIEGGTIGYELGYKEAIEVALKWLKRHDPDWSDIDTDTFRTDVNYPLAKD